MRAVIFGAQGVLAQALASELPAAGITIVTALGHKDCDIGDGQAVSHAVTTSRPDVVFNAAAFTDVDRAEDEADNAFRANALGAQNIARACVQSGATMVHYSTDFVFDGEQERPYDEFDPPSPRGVYARSKAAGDSLVQAATTRAFILRVGCVYGHSGKNFPSSLVRRLRAGETIRADRDRMASPTWIGAIARASVALARTNHFGLYHCTSNGETSWAAFAEFLAAELGLPDARVEALPTSGLRLKAPRPRRAILDNLMLRLRGLDNFGTWQDQARAYLASLGAP